MGHKDFNWNPDWDEVSDEAKLLEEAEGGQLYRMENAFLVVLNGGYRQMGRQYGLLLGDQVRKMRDLVRDEFIKQDGIPYEVIKEVTGKPFHLARARRHKELLAGIAEITGLDVLDLTILDEMLLIEGIHRQMGGAAQCTSGAVWGEMSRDGATYTGRCHDLQANWRDRLPELGAFLVMNPSGGDYSIAAPTQIGQVSAFIDVINSAGLYMQVNNAAATLGMYIYSNMASALNNLCNVALSFGTHEELARTIPFLHASNAYNCLTATPNGAEYYELGHERCVRTKPEQDGLTCRANAALDPVWGVEQLPDPAAMYSKGRRDNFMAFLNEDPSANDDVRIRKFLNRDFFSADGKKSNGAAFIESSLPGAGEEVTVWQTVTKPADRSFWWRIPTHGGWMKIDLRKYFASGESN